MAPKKQAVQKVLAKGSPKAAPKSLKAAGKPKAKGAAAKAAPVAAKGSKGESPSIQKAKLALKKETKISAVKDTVATVAPAKAAKAPAAERPEKPISKAKARKIAIEISANEAASALAQKWVTLNRKAEQIDTKPYNMKSVFEEKTAMMHKVLGWGYILANRNDRLEVLFKDGIKYLISNYKPG